MEPWKINSVKVWNPVIKRYFLVLVVIDSQRDDNNCKCLLVHLFVLKTPFNLYFATFKLFRFFLVGDVGKKQMIWRHCLKRGWGIKIKPEIQNDFNSEYFYRVCQDIWLLCNTVVTQLQNESVWSLVFVKILSLSEAGRKKRMAWHAL